MTLSGFAVYHPPLVTDFNHERNRHEVFPRLSTQLIAIIALLTVATRATAQPVVHRFDTATFGTIIIAHGGDSVWNARIHEVARRTKTGGPVEVSFLMGPGAKAARFQDAVARLEARGASEIIVVPMLVSSYSGHYDQIRYLAGETVTLDEQMLHHLHMSGIERAAAKVPLRVTKAMDASPEVARILSDRALALTETPRTQALLLVGHGPNSADDYAAWMENLRPVADSVKVWTGFRDVRVELVRDDAPAPVRAEAVRRVRELIELQHLMTGRDVIVVPVLVSKGSVSRDKVPSDIAGTRSVYAGEPLLPHAAMTQWVEARVREATREPAAADNR